MRKARESFPHDGQHAANVMPLAETRRVSLCPSVRRRREGLCVSTAERMVLAGAEYADPAISTVHGGEWWRNAIFAGMESPCHF